MTGQRARRGDHPRRAAAAPKPAPEWPRSCVASPLLRRSRKRCWHLAARLRPRPSSMIRARACRPESEAQTFSAPVCQSKKPGPAAASSSPASRGPSRRHRRWALRGCPNARQNRRGAGSRRAAGGCCRQVRPGRRSASRTTRRAGEKGAFGGKALTGRRVVDRLQHLGDAVVVGAPLDPDGALRDGGQHVLRRDGGEGTSSIFSRLRPAMARKVAAATPSSSFFRRVCTLPRNSTT